ncbi:hypothetical protein BGX30_003065 [Mortierella sp. GBA39]|nr:hypothetical protein BGX30_003065 [Mortierella sp. GBA39]
MVEALRMEDPQSIKAYISLMRECLPNDESKQALDKRLPQEAVDLLLEKFTGRFHPAAVTASSSFSENNRKDALSTASAPKIESHAKDIRKNCPENVYISMIATYPAEWTSKLPALPDATIDSSGVQHVVIHVGDANFGDIFPRELVEFIDRLKNAGKRFAGRASIRTHSNSSWFK